MPQKPPLATNDTYATCRVPSHKTLGGGHFAALYSAEHVAGGEFVIGVAFATWGASAFDVLAGLMLGNLLAVLSWALVCSPIAVRARITLYYYLERLAGQGLTRYYTLLNALIFAVIAGGMLTIAGSALNGLADAPEQIHWYPTSPIFVLSVGALGIAMVAATLRGFASFAQLSKLFAPWLMTVFVVSGLAALPYLWHSYPTLDGWQLLTQVVWNNNTDSKESLSLWQIAAFAWGLNLPLHLGMGDLSTLRFAKHKNYGYYSALAAYGGHGVAWVACGVLGATTALLVQKPLSELDIGGVVTPILGITGTLAVVLASLTTAVPSFYRACLGFSSLFAIYRYRNIACILGVMITIIACFPLIFLKWLNIMAYFNIALAPLGAVIACEHFVLPRFGIRPFWRELTQKTHNYPAIIACTVGVMMAVILLATNLVQLFSVFIWVYVSTAFVYSLLAIRQAHPFRSAQSPSTLYSDAYGDETSYPISVQTRYHRYRQPLFIGAMLALGIMLGGSIYGFSVADPIAYRPLFQGILASGSVLYFVCIIAWHRQAYQNLWLKTTN